MVGLAKEGLAKLGLAKEGLAKVGLAKEGLAKVGLAKRVSQAKVAWPMWPKVGLTKEGLKRQQRLKSWLQKMADGQTRSSRLKQPLAQR